MHLELTPIYAQQSRLDDPKQRNQRVLTVAASIIPNDLWLQQHGG